MFVFLAVDVPGPPIDLGKTAVTENSVSLKWDEPEDDGGRDITNYVIERRETTRSTWNNSMDSKTTGKETSILFNLFTIQIM